MTKEKTSHGNRDFSTRGKVGQEKIERKQRIKFQEKEKSSRAKETNKEGNKTRSSNRDNQSQNRAALDQNKGHVRRGKDQRGNIQKPEDKVILDERDNGQVSKRNKDERENHFHRSWQTQKEIRAQVKRADMSLAEKKFRRAALRIFSGINFNKNGWLASQANYWWNQYQKEKTNERK